MSARIDDEHLQRLLDDEEADNVPMRLPGHQGYRPSVISEDEVRERRLLMSGALASGYSHDQVLHLFEQRFGMSESAVKKLKRKVRDQWAEDDAEARPYDKAAARRRLLKFIGAAAIEGNWAGVAALERRFSKLEGLDGPSDRPTRHDDPATQRLTEAILHELGESDPSALRAMIEEQREVERLANRPPPTASATGDGTRRGSLPDCPHQHRRGATARRKALLPRPNTRSQTYRGGLDAEGGYSHQRVP